MLKLSSQILLSITISKNFNVQPVTIGSVRQPRMNLSVNLLKFSTYIQALFLLNRKGYLLSLYSCVKKKIDLILNYLQIIFFFFVTMTYCFISFSKDNNSKRTSILKLILSLFVIYANILFVLTQDQLFYLLIQSIMLGVTSSLSSLSCF